jgi:hypothetical protein
MTRYFLLITIFLSACGGGGSSSSGSSINQAPIADAGSTMVVNELENVSLDASNSSDSDGSITSYHWSQVSNGAPSVSLTNSDQVTSSFVAPDVGVDTTFEFELMVTDDDGDSATVRVSITVQDVGGAPSSIAGRSWGSEISLESGSGDVSDPIVRLGADGQAYVSWVQFDGTYKNLYVSVIDTQTEAQTDFGVVSSGNDSVQDSFWNYKYATYPESDIQILDNGNIFVSFVHGNGTDVGVAVYDAASQSWSTPQTLDTETTKVRQPRIVTNGTEVVLAWFQEDDVAGTNLWVSRYDSGSSTWNLPERLDNALGVFDDFGWYAGELQGVMHTNGDITLVWSGDTGTGSEDILVSRYANGNWETTVSIDSRNNKAGAPTADIDEDGNVHVAWVQDDGIYESIFYTRYDNASQTWSTPENIELLSRFSFSPDIEVIGQRVYITWGRVNSSTDGYTDIYVNEFSPGNGWLGENLITDIGQVLPKVGSDSQGGAMVVYHRIHTHYSKKDPGGAWTYPSHVTPYNEGQQHFFDLAGDGVGAVVWVAKNNAADDLILVLYK